MVRRKSNYSRKEKKLLESVKIGFPPKRIPGFVKYLEKERLIIQPEIDKAEVELKEAEALYLDAKKKFDSLKSEQLELEEDYKAILAFKENPNRQLEFYAPTENQEGQKEVKRRELRWFKTAAEVLSAKKEFMDPDVLYHTILNTFPKYKQAVENSGYSVEVTGKRVMANWVRGCELTNAKHKGLLVMYKGKVGLFAWVDRELVPTAPFMKPFMYKRSKTEEVLQPA